MPLLGRHRRGVVASAAPVTKLTDKQGGVTGAALGLDWQTRAERYYDTVGEIWYAAQFYGRIGKVDWFIERETEEGWERADEEPSAADQAAIDEWERIRDANGGYASLFSNQGRLRFLVGEYYLVVRFDNPKDEGPLAKAVETWEIRDKHEVEVKTRSDGTQTLKLGRGQKTTTYDVWTTPWTPVPGTAYAWRMWRPHPVRNPDADAPMRAVLDLCEELLLLRRAVRARARSRIPAGVALLPREAFPGNVPGDNETDPMKNPITKRLIESVTIPLADESDPASLVPPFLWVSSEHIKMFETWKLGGAEGTAYPESRIRDEIVMSIARGLDFPPEYLTGTGNVNHWGAWQIDDQMWKGHLQPVVQDIADDWNSTVLRPRWQMIGLDPLVYRLAYDPHALIVRPDRAKDAKDLYTLGVIGPHALREAAAFDEVDAPTEEELPVMLEFVGKAAPASPDAQQTTDQTPPEPAVASIGNGNGHGKALLWLDGAADMASLRCRELAGQRLRNLLRKHDASLCDEYRDVAAHDLAAALGRDLTLVVTRTERPEGQLVHGGTATLASKMMSQGCAPGLVSAVCDGLERDAARTLYDLSADAEVHA